MTNTKEGGHSCPPGGLENPPSQEDPFSWFLNPEAEIEQHVHRLPHWQQEAAYCFVTWRLADSLPREKLEGWRENLNAWLHAHPKPWDAVTETAYRQRFSRAIDDWLDAGEGSCVLRDSANAKIVSDTLSFFDGQRYVIDTFVVMPNHVHVLFRLLAPHRLEAIVKSWKGYSARAINARLGRAGTLWQSEYWDRLIRNERHLERCREYIRENPVKVRLDPSEHVLKEGGHSCPPGGLENPPSHDRLRWQCRRGMLELDELLNGYLEREYGSATDADKKAFQALLKLPDQELFVLFFGARLGAQECPPSRPESIHVIAKIRGALSD